ncbi:hypothetical protein JCM10213v2_000941 [Rhodosporidiobolus nylandii]
MLTVIVTALALALVVPYFVKLFRVLSSTRGQPGFIALFAPYAVSPALFFSQSRPRVFFSRNGVWFQKADLHAKYGSTVLLVPSLVPPKVTVLVGEGKLITDINADRKTFTKSENSNAPVLCQYGQNLLTADGENWRRHRRVAVSSFSERNVREVWDEAGKITREWHGRMEMDAEGRTLVKGVEEVIGKCAFGVTFPWPSPSSSFSSAGATSRLSFEAASSIVLHDFLPVAVLGQWALHLPFTKLRRLKMGYEQFEEMLKDMVATRKEEISSGHADGKHDLLMSDAYIFVVAGHETSANSLSTLFALLALYPEHQAAVHSEITAYLRSSASFSDPAAFNALPVTMATIQEGLRLAGPVSTTMKRAVRETWLQASDTRGGKRAVYVPEGSEIRENVSGAHYNAESWPDPFDFNPSRFLQKDWDRESFLPFSSRLRGCIGKQFALAEMVVVLALTLEKYRVEMPAHKVEEWKLREGEVERERRERVFQGGPARLADHYVAARH